MKGAVRDHRLLSTLLWSFLCGYFLLSSALVSAQTPQWRTLNFAPNANGARHDGLWFVDDDTGWICNLQGEVWKTKDGGYSWTNQVQTLEAFRSIAFLDHQHGFLGSVFDVNLLFSTDDGGDSWKVVDNIPEPRPAGMCGLWAVNDSTVYGCGRYSGPPTVLKSDYAGATWESIDLSAQATTLIDCYFTSPDSGFVVGGIGAFPDSTRAEVLWTGDGGDTWQVNWQGQARGEWGWKISFPTPEIGYVSLETDANSLNRFLKTTDGGATWSVLSFGYGSNFLEQGIGFATPMLGWLGGGETEVRQTSNGGATWTSVDWGRRLDRVFMLRDDLGYAVGQAVYKYSSEAVPTAAQPSPVPAPGDLRSARTPPPDAGGQAEQVRRAPRRVGRTRPVGQGSPVGRLLLPHRTRIIQRSAQDDGDSLRAK